MFTFAKFQAMSLRSVLSEYLKVTLFYLAQVPVLILYGALATLVITHAVTEILIYFPICIGIIFAVWFAVLIAIDLFDALFGIDLLLSMRFWKYLPKKPTEITGGE